MKVDKTNLAQLISQTQSNFNSLNLAISSESLIQALISSVVFIVCLVIGVNSTIQDNPISTEGKVVYIDEDGTNYVYTNISFEADW